MHNTVQNTTQITTQNTRQNNWLRNIPQQEAAEVENNKKLAPLATEILHRIICRIFLC